MTNVLTEVRDALHKCATHGEYQDALKALDKHIKDDGWQPIETAPRDGTLILGYFKHTMPNMRLTPVYFSIREECWLDSDERAWTEPTNWMPLPTPPKEQNET